MEEIKPLAEIIVSGYETTWKNGRDVAVFTKVAEEEINKIQQLCSENDSNYELSVWDAEEWLNSVSYNYCNGKYCSYQDKFEIVTIDGLCKINSSTTDDELVEFEKQILIDARDQDVHILTGLMEWLENSRKSCIENKNSRVTAKIARKRGVK